jgi:hypothetical protein
MDPLPMVQLTTGQALRHYPLRSLTQLLTKVVLGHLTSRPQGEARSKFAPQTAAIFQRLRAGWTPTAQDPFGRKLSRARPP